MTQWIYTHHDRMDSMKRIFIFPYGHHHDMYQRLIDDHPYWMVRPWGFDLIQIESPLDCRNAYHAWLLDHQGYKPLLTYHGLTTVWIAFLLIITSLSNGFLSMHLLYGLTILSLGLTHIPMITTIIINRFNHIDVSDLPVVVCLILMILYWFQPTPWFQYLVLQSMILILLWDTFTPFVRWIAQKDLVRFTRFKDKLSKGECLVKTNDGGFTKKSNASLTDGDEIAVKTKDMVMADGIIIHGQGMVNSWFAHQIDHLKPGMTIKAGSVIQDGSFTFKVVKPLSSSDFSKALTQLINVCMQNEPVKINALVITGGVILSLVGCIIFGFSPTTPIVLVVITTMILWLCPLQTIDQWFAFDPLYDLEHGLFMHTPCDPTMIDKIDTVIIDSHLLRHDNDLQVDQVYLTKKLDDTLFFHMVMHVLRKSDDACAKAIIAYIRNHNLTDTDFRLSQNVYKKGLDKLLDGSTIQYGDLTTLKDKGIDTGIIDKMDMDASNNDATMRYLVKDEQIIAIFRLKRPVYPRYKQLVRSLKQHGYTTLLYSSNPFAGSNHLQNVYEMDEYQNDADTLIERIHADQIRHHRYAYVHDNNGDDHLIDAVDLSISVSSTTKHNDLTIHDVVPLVLSSWLNHNRQLVHTNSIIQKIIPLVIIILMLGFGIIIPWLNQTIIEPTWLILLAAIIDIVFASNLFHWHYMVEPLKPDHSQSISIRIDGIDDTLHKSIEKLILTNYPYALIKWDDMTTLHLDISSDNSRYDLCQLIRSNGYAPKLIHEKAGK